MTLDISVHYFFRDSSFLDELFFVTFRPLVFEVSFMSIFLFMIFMTCFLNWMILAPPYLQILFFTCILASFGQQIHSLCHFHLFTKGNETTFLLMNWCFRMFWMSRLRFDLLIDRIAKLTEIEIKIFEIVTKDLQTFRFWDA